MQIGPWFSLATIYAIASLSLPLAIGIIGIKAMIPGWQVGAWVVITTLVVFLGWYVAVRQNQDNEVLKSDISEIKKAIGIKPASKTEAETTVKEVIETLDAQTKSIKEHTLYNYAYFKLANENESSPSQIKLVLDASGPVFLINYWISHGSANRNANDPAYWSVDNRKPLIPVVYPRSKEIERSLPIGDYIVEFDGLNGHWDEYISTYLENGKLRQKIRVVTNLKGEVYNSEQAGAK